MNAGDHDGRPLSSHGSSGVSHARPVGAHARMASTSTASAEVAIDLRPGQLAIHRTRPLRNRWGKLFLWRYVGFVANLTCSCFSEQVLQVVACSAKAQFPCLLLRKRAKLVVEL